MRKKICYFVLFIGWSFSGFAQNDRQVIPPSPISSEFEKYINYDVSLYNGVPDISIPLYTIRLKGVDVPVSLSYHASGIKFWQANGEVGLGWVLNPGYRISRTIYGQADEKYPMISTWSDTLNKYPDGLARDKFLGQYVDRDEGNLMPRPDDSYNLLDGEYDLFNYSLPTASGGFVIKDKINKIIQPIDMSNIKFDYAVGLPANDVADGFLKFDIKDEQGNAYFFGQHAAGDSNVFELAPGSSLPTAWAMTNMVTSTGDQLNFKYFYAAISGFNASARSQTIIQEALCANCLALDGNLCDIHVAETPYSNGGYRTFFLNEIRSKNEILALSRGNQNLVSQMTIYNAANVVIKAIKFYYSQGAANAHEFLDSIKITDNALNNVQTYRFTYIAKDHSSTEMIADQWGYYKDGGNYIANMYHQEFSDDHIPILSTWQPVSHYFDGFGNRSSAELPDWFSLSSITYPTGGRAEYEYESNKFLYNGVVKEGGGLRIASIKSHDLFNETLRKVYKYGENENGYGKQQFNIDESLFEDERLTIVPDPLGAYAFYPQIAITYSTNLLGDIGATGFSHSFVTYSEVTEHQSGVSLGYNGKTVNKFHVGTEYEVGPIERRLSGAGCTTHLGRFLYAGPDFVMGYRYWDKPYLIEQDYYSADNKLIRRDSFSYSIDMRYLEGLKVRPFATATSYSDLIGELYNFVGSFFRYSPYNITYGRNQLTNKKQILFNGGSRLVALNESYQYNDWLQLSKVSSDLSNGKRHHVFYSYPLDYAVGSGFVDSMRVKNILSTPVETVEAEEDPLGNIRILKGAITTFRTTNPALPQSALATESASSISQSAFKFANKALATVPPAGVAGIFSPDNSYVEKATYDSYDSYNNLIQLTSNGGQRQSYIWGYDHSYPIAQAINANGNEIFFDGFEEAATWNFPISLDQAKSHTGKASGKIYNPGPGELVSHSTKLLNISLTATTKFKYSGWVFSDGPSSEIFLFMKKSGEAGYFTYVDAISCSTTGKWVYIEKEFTVPADVVELNIRIDNNGAGTVWFDDIRLHRSGVQMNTYTYEPLIGMTSRTDINNTVIYYEYDAFNRLSIVRDLDRNILKKICYNYAGQPETCGMVTAPLWESTGTTRCQACAANASYFSNIREHQEKDNNPYSSSYNTYRWISDGVNGACVPVADWQNTVTALRCKTSSGNNTSDREQGQQDMNPCSATYNTTRWVVIDQNCTVCPKPVNWQVTGSVRCVVDGSGHNTSYQEREEKDLESCSPTYNTTRWVSVGTNCTTCPKPANWSATGNLRCVRDGSNNNTGYQEREERDLESCSGTYNTYRWVANGYNATSCPICATTCTGEGYKCLNNTCELGTKIYTSSVDLGRYWRCYYYYQWSDSSTSTTYFELADDPCIE